MFSATRNETPRVTYHVRLRQSVCSTHVFLHPHQFKTVAHCRSIIFTNETTNQKTKTTFEVLNLVCKK